MKARRYKYTMRGNKKGNEKHVEKVRDLHFLRKLFDSLFNCR